MLTARQKILAHLKKTRAASAREIARALKMSAPNVRHHLGILVSDGRLEMMAVHQRGGRGRPEKIYSLSRAALGDNLAALADALMSVEGFRLNVDGTASQLLDSAQFINLPITKRLTLLVEKLNEMHYQARWEAGAEGPRVLFGRCPYAKIIERHPELCKIDSVMLEKALGSRVERFTKTESGVRGLCPFSFRVE